MCALSATYRRRIRDGLQTHSPHRRCECHPARSRESALGSHPARADSPNGGAAIRAISICHCSSCGSCVRNQLYAERTSGDAARRATSCCSEGVTSDISARGGFGVMRFALVYAKYTKSLLNVRFCELFCLLMTTVIRLKSCPQKGTLRTSDKGNRFLLRTSSGQEHDSREVETKGFHWDESRWDSLPS